jgi:hypothetical protein
MAESGDAPDRIENWLVQVTDKRDETVDRVSKVIGDDPQIRVLESRVAGANLFKVEMTSKRARALQDELAGKAIVIRNEPLPDPRFKPIPPF